MEEILKKFNELQTLVRDELLEMEKLPFCEIKHSSVYVPDKPYDASADYKHSVYFTLKSMNTELNMLKARHAILK